MKGKLTRDEYLTAITECRPKRIPLEKRHIDSVISSLTGINCADIGQDEAARLTGLEDKLSESIVGQQTAIKSLCSAVRRCRAGLKGSDRPMGSFIFLGSTGVGKSQLAKDLAKTLFGRDNAIVKLDMSEYMERHSVSKLIGSPPGYVGFDEGGRLTEQIHRKPYCVLLLDEIEKAHPDIYNLLLQILEDGCLTDSAGRTVSFSNVLIIMTSNIGVKKLAETKTVGFSNSKSNGEAKKKAMLSELKSFMSPELLGRIDEVIVFNDLTLSDMENITRLEISALEKRLSELGCTLACHPEVYPFIAKQALSKSGSAREIRHIITALIENRISDMLISSACRDFSVCVSENTLTVAQHRRQLCS